MKTHNTRPLVAAFVAISTMVLSMCSLTADTILVSDDFSTGGTGRTTGANLNGTSPQVGSGTWTNPFTGTPNTTQYFEFTGSGTLERSINEGAESRIAFTAPSNIIKITAEMTPIEGTGWSGVAFTSDLSSSWYAAQTIVAGRIQNNSYFMGNASGSFGNYSGTITSFGWDKLYTMELSYNSDTDEARFQIFDGETSVGDTGWQGTFAGTVAAAAFSMRNAQAPVHQTITPYVDSFTVSAIPEPASIGVMLGILATLVFVGKRMLISRR